MTAPGSEVWPTSAFACASTGQSGLKRGALGTEHAHLLEPALGQTFTFHTAEVLVLAKSGLSSHMALRALGSRQTAWEEKTVSDRSPWGTFGISDKSVTVEHHFL